MQPLERRLVGAHFVRCHLSVLVSVQLFKHFMRPGLLLALLFAPVWVIVLWPLLHPCLLLRLVHFAAKRVHLLLFQLAVHALVEFGEVELAVMIPVVVVHVLLHQVLHELGGRAALLGVQKHVELVCVELAVVVGVRQVECDARVADPLFVVVTHVVKVRAILRVKARLEVLLEIFLQADVPVLVVVRGFELARRAPQAAVLALLQVPLLELRLGDVPVVIHVHQREDLLQSLRHVEVVEPVVVMPVRGVVEVVAMVLPVVLAVSVLVPRGGVVFGRLRLLHRRRKACALDCRSDRS
mmetsp:Transcript_33151/g.83603  ORF Transcript_33151/g.83603 Transcript_33151/m.83603 type:complete len:297 (+) Transcript_33151:368-1258(+)